MLCIMELSAPLQYLWINRESPLAGHSWHMNLGWKKFLEILLIKGESALLYPLLARAQTLPCCCFHLRLWKAGSTQHPSSRDWNPSCCKPDGTGSSALTFLQLQNGLQLQSHFFPPVDLVRATNPWLLLIYNRGKVILVMKKNKVYIFRHQDTIYHRDQWHFYSL